MCNLLLLGLINFKFNNNICIKIILENLYFLSKDKFKVLKNFLYLPNL